MAKKQINTDDIVLKLKEQVEFKEKELSVIKRPTFKTNNNLELYGTRYNLNVQTIDSLVYLCSNIINIFDNLNKAKELLNTTTECIYGGYTYEDWIEDFKLHILIKDRRNKEESLNKLKARLESLVSEELKTKIALDEITKDLNNL